MAAAQEGTPCTISQAQAAAPHRDPLPEGRRARKRRPQRGEREMQRRPDARRLQHGCAYQDRGYPRSPGAWHTALASVHEGAPLEGVSTVSEPWAAPGCSRQEPPGGDTSWLVLARAPRIPYRQRGRFAPLLTERAGCPAPPLPSPSRKPSSGKPAARPKVRRRQEGAVGEWSLREPAARE